MSQFPVASLDTRPAELNGSTYLGLLSTSQEFMTAKV
jgi:hypothetical protein